MSDVINPSEHTFTFLRTSQDGQDLAFYCKPYLLKLHFPHALRGSEEDEGRHCRAVYDADLVGYNTKTHALHTTYKPPHPAHRL